MLLQRVFPRLLPRVSHVIEELYVPWWQTLRNFQDAGLYLQHGLFLSNIELDILGPEFWRAHLCEPLWLMACN